MTGRPRRAGCPRASTAPRAAVPRILRLLDRRGIPASFFVPAVCALLRPDEVRGYAQAGHEVALHGWIHERNSGLPAAAERSLTLRAAETLTRISGTRLAGIRTPSWDFSHGHPGHHPRARAEL